METINYRNNNRELIIEIKNAPTISDLPDIPPWGLTIDEYKKWFEKLKELAYGEQNKPMQLYADQKLKEIEAMKPDDPQRLHYVIQPGGTEG